jgi:hypothetical protein
MANISDPKKIIEEIGPLKQYLLQNFNVLIVPTSNADCPNIQSKKCLEQIILLNCEE